MLLVFGLSLHFETLSFNPEIRCGGGDFHKLLLRLHTDFQLDIYPGTGRKVVVGGGWFLNANPVSCFGPNFFLKV